MGYTSFTVFGVVVEGDGAYARVNRLRRWAAAGGRSRAEIVVDPGGGRPPMVAEAKIMPEGRAPGRRA